MQQRVQTFHRRAKPSSGAQLPITAALHAEHLTLFGDILHQNLPFVNPHFPDIDTIILIAFSPRHRTPQEKHDSMVSDQDTVDPERSILNEQT